MEPLISVIVPIYKVETYLSKCIDSIIAQTYRNLEIILVDDGSPDSCGTICDTYKEKDNRIIVIHKKNGGLSDARNAGMEVANGEYFGFVDSDDFIHPQMYEMLMQYMLKQNAEVTVCDFEVVEEGVTPEVNQYDTEQYYEVIDEKEKFSWYIVGTTSVTFTVAWNKLYKRELFEGITYPKGKVHEDEFTTYRLLYRALKTVYVKTPLYFYIQRGGSITADEPIEKRKLCFEATYEKLIFYAENEEEKLFFSTLMTLKPLLNDYIRRIRQNHGDLKTLHSITKTLRQLLSRYRSLLKTKSYIKYFILFRFPYICYLAESLKKGE